MNRKTHEELLSSILFETIFFDSNFNKHKENEDLLTISFGIDGPGGTNFVSIKEKGNIEIDPFGDLDFLNRSLTRNIFRFNSKPMHSFRDYAQINTLVNNTSLAELTREYDIIRITKSTLLNEDVYGNDFVSFKDDFNEAFNDLFSEYSPNWIPGRPFFRDSKRALRITHYLPDGDKTHLSHTKIDFNNNTIDVAVRKDHPKPFDANMLSEIINDVLNTLQVKSIF